MDQNKKFPYLTDEQKDSVDKWFAGIGTNEECISSIDINPFYFLSKLYQTEDRAKKMAGLCLMSLCTTPYCKELFVGTFVKIVIKMEDLVVFLDTVKSLRGFGRVVRKAIYKWFRSKDPFKLDRLLSYNFGNTSWTNRDILCNFHIKPWNKQISAILKKHAGK